MANSATPGAVNVLWETSFEVVEAWLATKCSGIRPLSGKELARYTAKQAKAGWRIPFATGATYYELDLILPAMFPYAAPEVALARPPAFLSWPHLEKNGVLCLRPSHQTVQFDAPIAEIDELLRKTSNYLEHAPSGAMDDDFRAEFSSYWQAGPEASVVRTLLKPQEPSRPIYLLEYETMLLAGDDTAAMVRWMENFWGFPYKKPPIPRQALFLWLDQPLAPKEFPDDFDKMEAMITEAGLVSDYHRISVTCPKGILLVIGAPSVRGPVLAAFSIKRKAGTLGHGKPLVKGFRPGHAPHELVLQHMFSGITPSKMVAERVDYAWIHGRDTDPDLSSLRATQVILVGCGSLGGSLAMSLAQSGIGALDIVDPELLSAANIGRHYLGARSIQHHKATEIAKRIKQAYPHIIRAEGHAVNCEALLNSRCALFEKADLIISTTGNWPSEMALNGWRIGLEAQPDLIFGWTEPHAVAGHAVALVKQTGCFACGMLSNGQDRIPVAAWPNGTGEQQEPACGTMFQPYSPIQISHVVSLISETAIDILLDRIKTPVRRTWVGREQLLRNSGGVWSDEWRQECAGEPAGGVLIEKTWPKIQGCPVCGHSAQ